MNKQETSKQRRARLFQEFITGWGSALLIIILLALSTQGIIQFTLAREARLRTLSAILISQAEHSQREQRDSLLLLTKGQHQAEVAELARDIAGTEQNAALLKSQYLSLAPALATVTKTTQETYNRVDADVHRILLLERQDGALPLSQRQLAEVPSISDLFYAERDQLRNIDLALTSTQQAGDTLAARVRSLEWSLFGVQMLTWLGEGLFLWRVSRKIVRALDQEDKQRELEAVQLQQLQQLQQIQMLARGVLGTPDAAGEAS